MTVAERLRPDSLFEEFVAFRESLGMTILPLSGGQAPPLAHLEAYLREGGFVCLLADRDFGSRAVAVDLCDAPAQMPTGSAVLAQRTGALLMAATLHYVGDEMEIAFHGPFDVGPGAEGVATATQELADVFTEGLRRSPADWHMLQRVFLDDELTDLQHQEVD
jgi:KDO2-lipid IV(A) lauroyltransferase